MVALNASHFVLVLGMNMVTSPLHRVRDSPPLSMPLRASWRRQCRETCHKCQRKARGAKITW